MTNDYAGLVEYIVKNMVDHPDAVVIEALPGRGRSVTVEINLDPEDVGRVIGKGGRNIEAIRAVVKAAAIKDHERVNVEVIADDLPERDVEDREDRLPEGAGSNGAAASEGEAAQASVADAGLEPAAGETAAPVEHAAGEAEAGEHPE